MGEAIRPRQEVFAPARPGRVARLGGVGTSPERAATTAAIRAEAVADPRLDFCRLIVACFGLTLYVGIPIVAGAWLVGAFVSRVSGS